MRHFTLIALALIAGCAAARGDLGDTSRQIEARYGAAQETKKDAAAGVTTKFYIHGGMGIAVKFFQSKSQSETYIKGRKEALSDAEIAALLKANAMGSDWESAYKTAGTERWVLKSREATAVYSFTEHALVITTKEFIRSGTQIKLIDPDQ